jgi:hypothetical protein
MHTQYGNHSDASNKILDDLATMHARRVARHLARLAAVLEQLDPSMGAETHYFLLRTFMREHDIYDEYATFVEEARSYAAVMSTEDEEQR